MPLRMQLNRAHVPPSHLPQYGRGADLGPSTHKGHRRTARAPMGARPRPILLPWPSPTAGVQRGLR